MTVAQKLDKASGIFFFSGFLLSKLQYLPFPLISSIFRFISLGIYFLAYGCWSIACFLHPDHQELYNKWYGFAQIKEQFLFCSFLGLLGTVISTAAVFMPILFPPAAWIFLLGNFFWSVGEYHKLKNPPENNALFSYTGQKNQFNYAITSSSISLVTAIAATLIVFIPPLTIPVTAASLILCFGLSLLAFHFWIKSGRSKDKEPMIESYHQMMDSLELEPENEPQLSNSLEPHLSQGIFTVLKPKTPKETSTRHYSSSEHDVGHGFKP